MSAKQKIVHGRGLSNLNLGIFVCSFNVCRASKPVHSINYDTCGRGLIRQTFPIWPDPKMSHERKLEKHHENTKRDENARQI